MKIGCIIMAAGASERFGADKLLHPLAGRPVLSYTLEAVPRERLERVVAVARSEEVADLCREAGITALVYGGGPQSETVRRGIAEMAGMDGCLFLLGDQPLCTRRSMLAVAEEFEGHSHCTVRLAWGGEGGSPVLLPRSLFDRLAALTGDRGGMAAVREAGLPVRLVEAEGPQELWDVDTPQALSRIESYLNR